MPGTAAWRHELAGRDPIETAFARLLALSAGAGSWLTLADPATGTFRAALVADGALMAAVFLSNSHALPERDWLLSLFAAEAIGPDARRALLSGRPASGAARDPAVCVCHGVGTGAIRAAIANGCRSVPAVGAATRAGTNCGSCRPEIAAMLAKELEPA